MGRRLSDKGYVVVCPSYRLAKPSWPSLLLRSALAAGLGCLLVRCTTLFTDLFASATFLQIWGALLVPFTLRSLKTDIHTSAHHYDQPRDVALALAWVRKNLKSHAPDADVSSIFLSGHSAGAHLAALICLDPRYIEEVGISRPFIKGCILASGIYDMAQPLAAGLYHYKNVFFRAMYGAAAVGTMWSTDTWRSASPIYHVNKCSEANLGIPHFLLLSAKSDLGLEVDAQRMYDALSTKGFQVEYHVVEATNHANITSSADAYQLKFQFLQAVLNKQKSLPESPSKSGSGRPEDGQM